MVKQKDSAADGIVADDNDDPTKVKKKNIYVEIPSEEILKKTEMCEKWYKKYSHQWLPGDYIILFYLLFIY